MRMFLALLVAGSGVVVAQTKVPVVLELFTSEGCSSCPPADNVLSRLQREQPVSGVEIIALGEHVDYWDHLGWKDRYSSPLFTARQQDYGRQFRLESVYTPQLVVNGEREVVGSDMAAATQAIRAVAESPRATVSMKVNGNGVAFEVRGLPSGGRNADMYLAVTESNVESAVLSGENANQRLRHAPVVRSLTSLGKLDSKKDGAYSATAQLVLHPEWNRANVRLVLFVEDHASHKIVGAATMRL